MVQLLQKVLEEKNHTVVTASSGPDGLSAAQSEDFDAIVLDIMLPGLDGFEVARKLRHSGRRVPVLALPARDSVSNIVKVLDIGVDDYLTKPFALAEFMARLRAVARRGPTNQPPQLSVADLVLDPATGEVFRGQRPISLTKTEYSLPEFFMRRPRQASESKHDYRGRLG